MPTITVELSAAGIKALGEALRAEGFEMRPLQHGHFQARGPEVIVNAYRSGKVVLQGPGAEEFAARRLRVAPRGPGLLQRTAGSDEAGKGDYFGPLVVAAVVAGPADEPRLREARVRDGKTMSDGAVLRAALAVRELPHAVRALGPEEYNRRQEAEGNISPLLVDLHVQALSEALDAAGGGGPVERIVVDLFPGGEAIRAGLARLRPRVPLEMRPRAESNPAVAAASVLARAEFLIGLRELSGEWGTELPKGAGPEVDRVARDLGRAMGREALRRLAKLHFRTTRKALGP